MDAVEKGQGFLAQLRTKNFVRTTESEDAETIVETYHDRVRESVVNHLDEPTVRGHSLTLALTIEKVSGIKVEDLRSHIEKTADFEEPDEPYELEKAQWQRVFDLAYFFDAAGEHERAFPFALTAAEQATTQNAFEVAEQQFRIALRGAAQESVANRFRVLEGLGTVLEMRGRFDDAATQFDSAIPLASDDLAVARIEGKLGQLFFKKGDQGAAGKHLESALTKLNARPPGNFPMLLLGLMRETLVQLLHTFLPERFVARRPGNTTACRMDLVRARLFDRFTYVCWYSRGMEMTLWSHLRQMNLAERYSPSAELAKAYQFHAIVMTGLPLVARGVKYAKRSRDIWVDRGDRWGEGTSQSYQTLALSVSGQFSDGAKTSARAIELLDQSGDVWEGSMARLMHVWSLYGLGDMKRAYSINKEVVATSTEGGDYSSLAIAITFWMMIDAKSAPEGAAQAEVDRPRDDPLCAALAIQGRGLELLLRENKPVEAAQVLLESLRLARKKSIRNVCVFAGATWRVTALRIAAEQAAEGQERRRLIKQAKRAAWFARWVTLVYRTFRAHLLRECGLLELLAGRERQARRYFDESIEVAEKQEARRERAKTLLARGEAGMKFGWPGAEQEVAEGQATLNELEDIGVN
jgi:two-component system sensor kinase